jgi:cyclic pyranopterin phosphate synthase
MVDITGKKDVLREAEATGQIHLKPSTIRLIRDRRVEKGDPVAVAQVAAILAAKNTSQLIPLCHPLPITDVNVDIQLLNASVKVTAKVKTTAKTGVEMEALTATAIALLTIWDMVKRHEKDAHGQYPTTVLHDIRVVKKEKG